MTVSFSLPIGQGVQELLYVLDAVGHVAGVAFRMRALSDQHPGAVPSHDLEGRLVTAVRTARVAHEQDRRARAPRPTVGSRQPAAQRGSLVGGVGRDDLD